VELFVLNLIYPFMEIFEGKGVFNWVNQFEFDLEDV